VLFYGAFRRAVFLPLVGCENDTASCTPQLAVFSCANLVVPSLSTVEKPDSQSSYGKIGFFFPSLRRDGFIVPDQTAGLATVTPQGGGWRCVTALSSM